MDGGRQMDITERVTVKLGWGEGTNGFHGGSNCRQGRGMGGGGGEKSPVTTFLEGGGEEVWDA